MSIRRLQIQGIVRRAGVTGVFGIVLIAVLPAYYWLAVLPSKEEFQRLSVELSKATQQIRADETIVQQSVSRDDRIRAFHDFFPPYQEAPNWIAKIYAAADAEKLSLPRGEYRRAGSKNQGAFQFQIALPVKGSYAQIRRFLSRSLAEVPILALDDVSFQRQAAGETQLEAQVRFTLFFRNQ